VSGVDDAIDLAVGALHSCIRRKNGSVQCWGQNTEGQLGVNPSSQSAALTPVNVLGLP
jgi:alpha-tubulin suppressor-like RCC1 family protein